MASVPIASATADIRLKRLNRNKKAKRSQVKYALDRLSQAQQSYIQTERSLVKYSEVVFSTVEKSKDEPSLV